MTRISATHQMWTLTFFMCRDWKAWSASSASRQTFTRHEHVATGRRSIEQPLEKLTVTRELVLCNYWTVQQLLVDDTHQEREYNDWYESLFEPNSWNFPCGWTWNSHYRVAELQQVFAGTRALTHCREFNWRCDPN